MTEILQQPRKAVILGALLVFLFILGAVSDAFGAWSGIKAVFSPEATATHTPTYTPTHTTTPTSTPTPTMTPTLEISSLCQFRLGEIITSRKFLVPGGTANITVEYSNPSNQVLIFHWQANNGQMNPDVRTSSSQSVYRAPNILLEDTISVEVQAEGCPSSFRARGTIYVVSQDEIPTETSTPEGELTPTSTVTLTPTITPSATPTPELERIVTVYYHPVESGDTLNAISLRYIGSVNGAVAIRIGNNISTLRPGQTLVIPTYTVQNGDTVGNISRYFGISEDDLAEGNNLRNRNIISVGQVLVIPVNCWISDKC